MLYPFHRPPLHDIELLGSMERLIVDALGIVISRCIADEFRAVPDSHFAQSLKSIVRSQLVFHSIGGDEAGPALAGSHGIGEISS